MSRFDMKKDWDARAREAPLRAIACDEGKDEVVFQATGWRDAAIVLEGIEPLLPSRERMLEIGCGVGRLLEPLTAHFHRVYGVDVSGEMVRKGHMRLAHLPQVQLLEVDGSGSLPFAEGSFDFCFSYITFHHIPDKRVVHAYLAEAYRVLKAGGIFRFHTFGRLDGFWQTVRECCTRKSTWRGAKFTEQEAISMTRQADFEMVETRYVDPTPGQRPPFFGKNQPHVIWITARKPGTSR